VHPEVKDVISPFVPAMCIVRVFANSNGSGDVHRDTLPAENFLMSYSGGDSAGKSSLVAVLWGTGLLGPFASAQLGDSRLPVYFFIDE
jgi:hypothetical protein